MRGNSKECAVVWQGMKQGAGGEMAVPAGCRRAPYAVFFAKMERVCLSFLTRSLDAACRILGLI
jgi:hypothetical protein